MTLPLRIAILVLTLSLLPACVTETSRVDQPDQPRDPQGLPQEVLRVPQQMQDVSGDLLRYHANNRALPATLENLLDAQIMSTERFAELPDYLYHPRGLGRLRDGRTVILVDSEVRIEGHAWCIVREPTINPMSITLNVTPVAWVELEAAATP